MMKRIATSLILGLALCAQAQVPIGKAPERILLRGGVLHLGTGEVLEGGSLGLADGKIVLVAPAGQSVDTSGYKVVELQGAHVYPGFILPNTNVGLEEVSSLRATLDTSETGDLNPNVRSLIAYNTDSELIPTLRYCGITTAQIVPQGGLVSGTSSVVALEGWNWEDAAYVADNGVHVNWPDRYRQSFDFETFTRVRKQDEDYDSKLLLVQTLFRDALAYGKEDPKTRRTNLKLEALQGVFSGAKTVYLHADAATTIAAGVLGLEQLGAKRIVLVGGQDAVDVASFLVEHKVPVILGEIHRVPRAPGTDVNLPYKVPALLKAAGVDFCLSYPGITSCRNLPFLAGTAAAWGLSKEEALATITSNTARILGIDDRTGSLAVGKDANVIVSKGDALDMRTNLITHVFVRGKDVPLEGMQQRYFERYKAKYTK